MSVLRFNLVQEAFSHKAVPADIPAKKVSDYYGIHVFHRETMSKYLPGNIYNQLLKDIDSGKALNITMANHLAKAMKIWAMELGVTHYTHWFHPLTDGTAEKHDALILLQ
jgi:glutamine synthetase